MRVGLLSQWFDPEPGAAAVPGVLARELALRGHEVKVLTGFPNYALDIASNHSQVWKSVGFRFGRATMDGPWLVRPIT
jgi:colanic acid biosynthesis glycosyl transferase WcaI